jgi:hypothetical protein
MTIRYALSRTDILRSFFRSLKSSPKFLAVVLTYSVALGLLSMLARGDFSRPLTSSDILIGLAWTAVAFFFMPAWFLIRYKPEERTLTTSPEGITTEMGDRKATVPWSRIKQVQNTWRNVLIVGVTGNAIVIPSRAFQGPEQQAEFVAEIEAWRNANASG